MDHGSEELFSEREEETNDEGTYQSSESDYEDEPALLHSAPLLSKKQQRPRFLSENREGSRSNAGSGYYDEWLIRRDNARAKTATHRPGDARTPSGRPQSHSGRPRKVTESDRALPVDSSLLSLFWPWVNLITL